jgi:hypothetical protein
MLPTYSINTSDNSVALFAEAFKFFFFVKAFSVHVPPSFTNKILSCSSNGDGSFEQLLACRGKHSARSSHTNLAA